MKSIKIYLIFLLAGFFLFNSCSDFLEEENRSSLTDENAFSDPEVFDQFVANVYGNFRTAISFTNPDLYGTDIVTRKSPVTGVDQLNDYVNLLPTNWDISTYWRNYYNVINAANLAISRETEIQDIDGNDRQRGLGEVKFLRAISYFRLVEQFGGIPLKLDEITTAQTDFVRASEEVVYAQILSDLDDALAGVDEKSPEYGRVTKDAVRHLKAKVLLTRGYKSFGASTDFADAAELAQTVIANHPLVDDFASLVDIDNQRNREVIFAVLFGRDPQAIGVGNFRHKYFKFDYEVYPGMGPTTLYNQGYGNTLTPFYFSLFEENDQRPEATFRRVIYAIRDFDEDDANAIFEGDTAIYFPKQSWTDVQKASKPYKVINPEDYFTSDGYTNVHYPMFRKFDDPDVFYSNAGVDPKGQRDAVIIRTGETVLLAAEAYFRNGDLNNAARLLTQLRNRAGISGPVSEDEVTIDFILDESARELAGEISRWMELKRTGKLIDRVLKYNPHAALNKALKEYHYYRPIPQSEIDLTNRSIVQNEGYSGN